MRPLQITFRGLRSYITEQTIDFRGRSLVGITGDTGAGKSTILIAINFALFGTCTFEASSPKVLIADGGDGTLSVSFTFEARGREWTIHRRISHKTSQSIHRLEASDGSQTWHGRDATARIKDLIGLDQKTFLRSVLLPQGKFERLLHAPTAERARMLKGLLGLDVLNDIAIAARERYDRLNPLWQALYSRRRQLLDDPRAAAAAAETALADADKRIAVLSVAQQTLAALTTQQTTADEEHTALGEALKVLQSAAKTDAAERLNTLAQLDAQFAAREEELRTQLHAAQQIHDQLGEQLGERRPGGTQAAIPHVARQRLSGLRERVEQYTQMLADQDAEIAALTDLEKEVAAADTVWGQNKTALGTAEGELVTAQTTWKALDDQVTGYREELRTLRQRHAEVERLRVEVNGQQAVYDKAKAALDAAEEAVEIARMTETGLETVLEHHRRVDAAAHAATGLLPGDACPVCSRELPADFTAPAESGLTTANRDYNKARTDTRKATDAHTKALAAELAAAKLVSRYHRELQTAVSLFDTALHTVTRNIGAIDLAILDDVILAVALQRLNSAQDGVTAATTRVEQFRGQATTAQTAAQALHDDIERRTMALTASKKRLAAYRRKTDLLIGEVPALYRPAEATLAAVEDGDQRAEADMQRLAADWAQLAGLEKACKDLQEQLNGVGDQRTAEVGTPAKASQQKTLRLATAHAAVATLLHQPAAPQIDLQADVAGQAAWAAQVQHRAEECLRHGPDRLSELTDTIVRLRNAAADVISQTPTDGKSIGEALHEAIGAKAVANEALTTAAAQIAPADDLQSRLDSTKPHLDALAELVRLLADGQFVAAAVAERQRTLLAAATAILRDMTHSRFAFGYDFQIFDSYTCLLREVKTLSGGETFQASLALALAVVEQAASAGGRSGSLFLDEGFATLDHEALSYALDALSTQVSAGRLVVVISHMRAVAQQVPALLRVAKSASGSAVRWATDEELAELADESFGDGLHD